MDEVVPFLVATGSHQPLRGDDPRTLTKGVTMGVASGQLFPMRTQTARSKVLFCIHNRVMAHDGLVEL